MCICFKIPIGLRSHVGLRWVSTGISLQLGMLVSDGACWSLMGHVGHRSLLRHVGH